MKKNPKVGFSLIELSVVILIIGILVIGVAQGSRIIREAKLKSARSLTLSSPVVLNPNLALWLETTSEKSIDSAERVEGGAISAWYDINPQVAISPMDVTQTTAISKPSYVSNGANGLPSIRFDGVNDFFQRTNVSSSDLSKTADQITMFVVQQYVGSSHASSAIYWENVAGNRFNLHAPWVNGVMYFDFGYSSTGTDSRLSYTPVSAYYGKTNIISGVRRSGGVGKLRINGTEYTQSSSLTASLNSATSTLNIAKYVSLPSSNSYQNSYINEIIIYRTGLTDSEISSIENYLSTKWGVQLRGL